MMLQIHHVIVIKIFPNFNSGFKVIKTHKFLLYSDLNLTHVKFEVNFFIKFTQISSKNNLSK